MERLIKTLVKSVFVSFPLLIGVLNTNGQSLPNKQEKSLRAPVNIKIDGKLNEWDNKSQAYNHATDIYYTVANDDKNLYLAIQVTKPRIIEKIMNAGITVTINDNKNNDNQSEGVSILYPLIEYSKVPKIIMDAGAQTADILYSMEPGARQIYKPEGNVKPNDSLRNEATKILNEAANTIKIKGIKEIPDEEISVYNEQQIKVGVTFDHNGNYNYELSIPLKYLNRSTNDNKKINYNIKLQSRLNVLRAGMVTRYANLAGHQEPIDEDIDMDSTTDFWGEYILAKQ